MTGRGLEGRAATGIIALIMVLAPLAALEAQAVGSPQATGAAQPTAGAPAASPSRTPATAPTAGPGQPAAASPVTGAGPGQPAAASPVTGAGPSGGPTQSAAPAPPPSPLPDGFRSIHLGMSFHAVEVALEADPLFNYQGPPDVSMLPSPNENLIETNGYSYVTRAFFQFYDKKLFTIILMLDPAELSYYTMYTTLTKKYGEPVSLSPNEVVWESKQVRLSLERPLSVKYIDLPVFDKIKAAGQTKASERAISREKFLSQF